MKGKHLAWIAALVVGTGAAACGDNSDLCGPGTTAVDGVCTPAGSGSGTETCGSGTTDTDGVCVPNCTGGTVFDPAQGCVFDPNQCHDGTVFIVGQGCVDPTSGLTVDVMEGAEPNGAINHVPVVIDPTTNDPLEANAVVPAGAITIKDVGQTEVVKGTLAPFQDNDGDGYQDGDCDVYTVHVTAPALVNIAVDGVDGAEGGLLAVELATSATDPLANYVRFAVNLSGDTASRQMLFPAAGDYAIAVVDSRTLELGGPYGGSGADYYMSIAQVAFPTAGTAVTVGSDGHFGSDAETITSAADAVFQVPMGLGFNTVTATSTSLFQFAPDFAIYNDGGFKAIANVQGASVSAGYAAGDTTLVIVDPVIDLAPDDPGATYDLEIRTSVNAKPFCATDCSGSAQDAGETEVQNAPPLDFSGFFPVFDPTQLASLNTWFYDAAAGPESDAFAVSFDKPVDGVLFDANGNAVAAFTGYTGNTMTGYDGQIRVPAAGRYYFVAYDPAGAPGDSLTATTQEAPVAPVALTFNAQSGAQAVNFANSNLFTYSADANTNPWETFAAQSAKTGDVTAHFYDPTTAFGRLDPMTQDTTVNNGGANVTFSPDAHEVFSLVMADTNNPVGHILLDDSTTNYLVTTNAETPAGASFKLSIGARTFVDLGSENIGDPQQTHTESGQANGAQTFFLLRTAAGNLMSTALNPTGTLAPNVELDNLANDESQTLTLGPSALGGGESAALPSHPGGWLAFSATATGIAVGTGSYDVVYSVAPEGNYGSASVNATFTDLTTTSGGVTSCSGGATKVAFTGEDGFPADDEGVSDLIAAPAGFQFFGADVGAFRVSTNGFLSLESDLDGSFGVCAGAPGFICAVEIPTAAAPTAIVAPFWTDLFQVVACTKTTGQTETIEWVGFDNAGQAVKVQAVLDAGTQQITLLWSGATKDNGADASIGIEDFAGTTGTSLGFDSPIAIPGSIRFSVQ